MLNHKIDAGDGSYSAIGTNNNNNTTTTVNTFVINGVKIMKTSEIYKVCCVLAQKTLQNNYSFDVSGNANWNQKILFNQLVKYRDIFELYMPYYDDIHTILSSSEIDGESLIRNIKTIYINIKYSTNKYSADMIIDCVFEELYKLVEDPNPEVLVSVETKKDTIYLVVFYVFTMCQILEKPI